MSDKKFFDRNKHKANFEDNPDEVFEFSGSSANAYPPRRRPADDDGTVGWRAVASAKEDKPEKRPEKQPKAEAPAVKLYFDPTKVSLHGKNTDFNGKDLKNSNYENADLKDYNFSVSDLSGTNFSGAKLHNVDFSGANLTDVNFSGADLSGAVLSGANLLRTNFTGAVLKGVVLTEANLENAILLDVELDDLGIEELQALIEYMAKYYPERLDLRNLNLTLLDLSKIDLSRVSLRGVDFTGVDFTGVNIMELDLSECNITPEQIAQALGHKPSAAELAKILAPKTPKKKEKKNNLAEFFYDDGKEFGVWDFTKSKGIDIGDILEAGKKVFRRSAPKPPVKDEEFIEQIKEEKQKSVQSDKERIKEKILKNKEAELNARKEMKKEFSDEMVKEEQVKTEEKPKQKENLNERIFISRDRGRDF